jgi:hypothetical protein
MFGVPGFGRLLLHGEGAARDVGVGDSGGGTDLSGNRGSAVAGDLLVCDG